MSGTTAQLVTTSFAGGAHTLTAAYAGDTHNNPSASVEVPLSVVDALTPPAVTMTGIADGASFVTNSGNTYTGGSVSVNATAAAGNLLTRITIYFNGSSVYWTLASASYTQAWNLPALVPGAYTIFASAQDNQGHTTTLAPVRFVVNAAGATPPTGVVITSPLNGASFISPETITLTASATPASGKTISYVSFYAGASVVAVANTSPYAAPWFNSQPGTYSVMALATDSAGGMTLSSPITVVVGATQPPTVAITLPGAGASYTAPATIAIAASATAAAGASITQVEFLRGATVVGSATAAPYTFNWTNVAAGSYSISARATDSRTAKTTSAAVPVTVAAGAPALSISAAAGLDGSTVNEATMLVNGTITAPSNSGVTVNGMLAVVSPDAQFSVNDVPLAAGPNTITLTVTTQDGATASQAITVTSSGSAAPFTVTVDEPDGIAPHTVSFRVSGGGTPVATIDFDVDGNGTVDLTTPGIPPGGVTATYSTAGTVRPRITFKDASGAVLYTTTKQVHVVNALDKYNLINGVFSDLISRLGAGNTTLATNVITAGVADKYRAVFAALGTDLPSIASQLGDVRQATFNGSTAHLYLVRSTPTGNEGYFIYLIRGPEGIWRIDGM